MKIFPDSGRSVCIEAKIGQFMVIEMFSIFDNVRNRFLYSVILVKIWLNLKMFEKIVQNRKNPIFCLFGFPVKLEKFTSRLHMVEQLKTLQLCCQNIRKKTTVMQQNAKNINERWI
jgi:hypothetical protein